MEKAMIYKKDYFGYVYLWFDTKRTKFCIGSHHGAIDDSYITSSKYMLNAYSRRPEDFKMRVLEYNTTSDNYLETQKLEQKALNYIKDEELGSRYYNLKKWATGGNNVKGKNWFYNPFNRAERGFYDIGAEPTGWVKGHGYSSTINYIWYYDPNNISNCRLISPSEIPSDGWVKGRPAISCTGYWFKDPLSEEQGRFEDIDDVPYGWVRGRHDAGTTGTKWIYNAHDKKMFMLIMDDEGLPDGWQYGMSHRGSCKSYYNPRTNEERKFFDNETIPEDFIPGGKPRSIKKQEKFGTMTDAEFNLYCKDKSSRAIKMVRTYREQYNSRNP